MQEEQLIFIISQPRSGSTYLQNLLSNNSEVNTCSEPWVLLNFLNQIKPELVRTKVDNQLATEAFGYYKTSLSRLDYKDLLKKHVLSIYSQQVENHQFFIDKTPRYWEIINEIALLFPKSKIIVLHRNPIDVFKSIMTSWNLKTFRDLNLFRRDVLFAPKALFSFCEAHKNNTHIYSLHYEQLISQPLLEVEKLYNWIGIPFSEQVLNTENNKKYRGVFGDPFQNAVSPYAVAKQKMKTKILSNNFKKLLLGYSYFLGADFMRKYGYKTLINHKDTLQFRYFLHLGEDEKTSFGISRKCIWYFKDYFYKLIYGL